MMPTVVSLHRDVGESELKQGREIRAGGQLVYVDSAACRAAKSGAILVLDGIERCERGVLPILNNLLENRSVVFGRAFAGTVLTAWSLQGNELGGWHAYCVG